MSQIDHDRLLKVLGMTGSDQDGEALAALRKAQAIMSAAKVTWSDLIKAQPYAQMREEPQGRPSDWDDEAARLKVRRCASMILEKYPFLLNEWEKGFLSDWEQKPDHWSMSTKQRAIFVRIINRWNHYMNMRKSA